MRLSSDDREMLRLAVPALAALAAEPLFLLVDSAIVGRLGTASLAGLGAAGTVLLTTVGLCVFLAYGTTAAVARLSGAGEARRAMAVGVDGCWLAFGLGITLGIAGWTFAAPLVRALGATGPAEGEAIAYLHTSLIGLPGMLLVLAATGVMRGLADTKTPFFVAATGAIANAPLNWLLVFGLDMGIAGSGLGTALVQLVMGAVLARKVVTGARAVSAPLTPDWAGIRASARTGAPLLVRTVCLRVVLVATTWAAGRQGAEQLAAHQVVMALWSFLALALDAIAIAAQTMTGSALGAGRLDLARSRTARMTRWGVGFGVLVGLLLAVTSAWLPGLFSDDAGVRAAVTAALLVAALGQPISGYVFVLDGVFMGAGDGVYLAWASVATMLLYAPMLVAVIVWAGGGVVGFAWLWAAFAVGFLLARALTLALRQRSGGWAVVGAVR